MGNTWLHSQKDNKNELNICIFLTIKKFENTDRIKSVIQLSSFLWFFKECNQMFPILFEYNSVLLRLDQSYER